MLHQRKKALVNEAPSTHDRTRPMLHQRKKALVNEAPSTHDPNRLLGEISV
jgi:hypothetical protein